MAAFDVDPLTTETAGNDRAERPDGSVVVVCGDTIVVGDVVVVGGAVVVAVPHASISERVMLPSEVVTPVPIVAFDVTETDPGVPPPA